MSSILIISNSFHMILPKPTRDVPSGATESQRDVPSGATEIQRDVPSGVTESQRDIPPFITQLCRRFLFSLLYVLMYALLTMLIQYNRPTTGCPWFIFMVSKGTSQSTMWYYDKYSVITMTNQ